jgi:hypothetical protein
MVDVFAKTVAVLYDFAERLEIIITGATILQKTRAIETARRLYEIHGKRTRGGALRRVRPTPHVFATGNTGWAVQIEIAPGFGGAAFSKCGAFATADDLLRLWRTYGPQS